MPREKIFYLFTLSFTVIHALDNTRKYQLDDKDCSNIFEEQRHNIRMDTPAFNVQIN